MSIRLMTAAFMTALPTTQKFVLVALCDNANDEGFCFPKISTLSKKTSLSYRAVYGAIRHLVEMGFMTVTRRTGDSSVYWIQPPEEWPELDSRQEVTPDSDDSTIEKPVDNIVNNPVDKLSTYERGAGGVCTTCIGDMHDVHRGYAPGAYITIKNHHLTVREPAREREREIEPANPPKEKPPERKNFEKPKRTGPLPDNWFLPKSWGVWAMTEQGLTEAEVREQAKLFFEHWHGKGESDAGWKRVWRFWVLNFKKRNASRDDPPEAPRPAQSPAWWKTDEGVDKKGRELGIMPRIGEDYSAFKNRIFEEIARLKKGGAPPQKNSLGEVIRLHEFTTFGDIASTALKKANTG